MQGPIQCEFRWTLDEFLTANAQNRRHSPAVRKGKVIFWALTLVLLLGGTVRATNRHGFDYISAVLLGGGAWLIGTYLFYRRMLVAMFAKQPDRDADIRVEIYPDRVILASPTSKTETTWSRFQRCHRTDEGFLLVLPQGSFFWLPLHGFAKPSDIDYLDQLVASQLGPTARQ